MTFGSLFAGIGGFDLGFERAGMTCSWQVEISQYSRAVLEKHWPDIRRHDDARTFPDERDWSVDVICGGFPCINISSSGKKDGIDGEHSSLWREMLRIIRHLRPRYVVVENVSDITVRGIDEVLGSLSTIGFDAEWETIPAAAFGLPQRRWRTFIVANSDGWGREGCEKRNGERAFFVGWDHDDGLALAEHRSRDVAPGIVRVADGVPRKVDRTRALGNAVVPQIAEWIGRRIVELHY